MEDEMEREMKRFIECIDLYNIVDVRQTYMYMANKTASNKEDSKSLIKVHEKSKNLKSKEAIQYIQEGLLNYCYLLPIEISKSIFHNFVGDKNLVCYNYITGLKEKLFVTYSPDQNGNISTNIAQKYNEREDELILFFENEIKTLLKISSSSKTQSFLFEKLGWLYLTYYKDGYKALGFFKKVKNEDGEDNDFIEYLKNLCFEFITRKEKNKYFKSSW